MRPATLFCFRTSILPPRELISGPAFKEPQTGIHPVTAHLLSFSISLTGRTAAFIGRASRNTRPGNRYIGSVPLIDLPGDLGHGGIRALNPQTGERMWEYTLQTKPWAGVLSTAGQLIFGGSDEGYFFALDAETGKELWRKNLGGIIRANPVTYLAHGKQLVSIAAGNAIFTFSLPRQ